MKKIVWRLIVPIAVIVGWHILYSTRWYSPLLLPAPVAVGRALISLFFSGPLFVSRDALATVYRMGIGLLFGVSSGLILGIFMGSWKIADQLASGPVDFLRSIPATALLPLFLLFLGVGDAAKIAPVVLVVALIMTVQTAQGIKQTEPTRLSAARIMGFSRWQIFRRVLFFEVLPAITTGIKISLSFGLILVVVSEMFVGTQYGLGKRILEAQLLYHTDELYAFIIFTGFLGYCINAGFNFFEIRLVHWAGK